jgi:hypothetical protein
MFNGLLGHASRGGGAGDANTLPPLDGGVIFDEADAAADFDNELRPLPAAATVT